MFSLSKGLACCLASSSFFQIKNGYLCIFKPKKCVHKQEKSGSRLPANRCAWTRSVSFFTPPLVPLLSFGIIRLVRPAGVVNISRLCAACWSHVVWYLRFKVFRDTSCCSTELPTYLLALCVYEFKWLKGKVINIISTQPHESILC